jgi:hypothetical protein
MDSPGSELISHRVMIKGDLKAADLGLSSEDSSIKIKDDIGDIDIELIEAYQELPGVKLGSDEKKSYDEDYFLSYRNFLQEIEEQRLTHGVSPENFLIINVSSRADQNKDLDLVSEYQKEFDIFKAKGINVLDLEIPKDSKSERGPSQFIERIKKTTQQVGSYADQKYEGLVRKHYLKSANSLAVIRATIAGGISVMVALSGVGESPVVIKEMAYNFIKIAMLNFIVQKYASGLIYSLGVQWVDLVKIRIQAIKRKISYNEMLIIYAKEKRWKFAPRESSFLAGQMKFLGFEVAYTKVNFELDDFGRFIEALPQAAEMDVSKLLEVYIAAPLATVVTQGTHDNLNAKIYKDIPQRRNDLRQSLGLQSSKYDDPKVLDKAFEQYLMNYEYDEKTLGDDLPYVLSSETINQVKEIKSLWKMVFNQRLYMLVTSLTWTSAWLSTLYGNPQFGLQIYSAMAVTGIVGHLTLGKERSPLSRIYRYIKDKAEKLTCNKFFLKN